MYLLDTNVVSELRRGPRADSRVIAWVGGIESTDCFLSSVTILEIERGILLVARRDKRQGAALKTWLEEQLMPEFTARILPVDLAVARQCAALQVPNPRPHLDALIAATALVHRLTLVTRNTADFARSGVSLLNPWD